MNERALYAAVAVIAGIAVGTIVGGLTRRAVLRRQKRQEVATPAAALVFWVALAIGIAVGAGLLAPDAVRPLPSRMLDYLPRILVAGLILIVGYAAATISAAVLGGGLARATGRTRREAATGLRVAIFIAVALLALGQLGVDTTLLTIGAAALLFGSATALALLIGLGGRDLAKEVAAGRYLRRLVRPGDQVETAQVSGRIAALHPATTELDAGPPGTVHVPNSLLLRDVVRVNRQVSERRSDDQPESETFPKSTPRQG